MKNAVVYIKTEKKTYPLMFNLNVMEEIQEKYGSVSEWGKMTDSPDGADIKTLKFGIKAMMNEAIDIQNEENGTNEPMLDEKQVGRILSEVGLKAVLEKIKEITIASTKGEDDGKNE